MCAPQFCRGGAALLEPLVAAVYDDFAADEPRMNAAALTKP